MGPVELRWKVGGKDCTIETVQAGLEGGYKMVHEKRRFSVDEKGRRTAVVIPIREYRELRKT